MDGKRGESEVSKPKHKGSLNDIKTRTNRTVGHFIIKTSFYLLLEVSVRTKYIFGQNILSDKIHFRTYYTFRTSY